MIKSIEGWFKGLFAPRTKAQGLSSEPTYSQVERLIAAAGGASAQGGSLYSKPTYSQFERLIAAVAASSAGSAAAVKSVKVGTKSVSPTDGVLALPVTNSATSSDGNTLASAKAVNTVNGRVTDMGAKIPSQASASNQLADKDFVNSSVATSTATFRGTYVLTGLGLAGDPFSATHADVAAAVQATLDRLGKPYDGSDYVFVQVPQNPQPEGADPGSPVMSRVDRYKCVETGTDPVVKSWEYEWTLNNSSFTAEQWAAINSGITSGKIDGLRGKLDLRVYDFLPETWEVSGDHALFSGGTYTWDDASAQWLGVEGQRAIRAKAGTPNTYQLVFDPGLAKETTVCEWEGTAEQTVPFAYDGDDSFAVTVEGRGNAGLKPTGDALAKESAVAARFAQAVTGASYSSSYAPMDNRPAILLKHGDTVLAAVDASAFIVDGMVEDVYIGDATSGPEDDPDESGKLVVRFNADAGSKVVRIPLTGIFNPDNYPTKSYVDTTFVEKGATNILIGSGASKANNVTNAVVIGVNASANGSTTSSAVAIGNGAKAKKTGAIQLGAGENSEEKSLRFRDTAVVGGDGKIPTSSLRDFPALESVPDRAIAASTAYAVGDVLGDGGKAYRCKSAYTSAADPMAPSEDAEHWKEVPVLDSVTAALAGETMPAVPTQNELADAVKKIFTALGGGIDPEVDQEEEK